MNEKSMSSDDNVKSSFNFPPPAPYKK